MARRQQDILLQPYLWTFGVCYLALTIAAAFFFWLTGLPANIGMSFGILIGSATFAGQTFVSHHNRTPDSTEVLKLTLGSLLISVALSLFVTIVALALSGVGIADIQKAWAMIMRELEFGGALIVILAASAFHLLALWLSYGPLTRFIFKHAKK